LIRSLHPLAMREKGPGGGGGGREKRREPLCRKEEGIKEDRGSQSQGPETQVDEVEKRMMGKGRKNRGR